MEVRENMVKDMQPLYDAAEKRILAMPLVDEVNLDDYPELKALSRNRADLFKRGLMELTPGIIYDRHYLRPDDYTSRGIRSAELESARVYFASR